MPLVAAPPADVDHNPVTPNSMTPAAESAELAQWLARIEHGHPRAIDLGLDRVRAVWRALGAPPPARRVITVAGTNGKGSVVRDLESVLLAAGRRTGVYTSPHLRRYNERVRIAGREVDDAALIAAFEQIEAARGALTLTYFEYGTLAALWLFAAADLEVAVLEVGMGGRLDAVNIIDPDIAVITAIGLDHQQWLGRDRDAIGREKAGIVRPGRPVVLVDREPPSGLLAAATAAGARLYRLGVEFDTEPAASGWRYRALDGTHRTLPAPALRGRHQFDNAAGALAALELLAPGRPLDSALLAAGLGAATLAGRFQQLAEQPEIIVDVAHNPPALSRLAATLAEYPAAGRTLAVFAMLADKDLVASAIALAPAIDAWYLAPLPPPRGATLEQMASALTAAGIGAPRQALQSVSAALHAARRAAGPGDRIIACGSFLTAQAVLAGC